MSSRSATEFDTGTQTLARSAAEGLEARMQGNGPTTQAMPSRQAQRALDEQRMPTTSQAAGAQNARPMDVVDSDKPTSIWNRPTGWRGKSNAPRFKEPSMKRSSSVVKAVKDRMANAFKRSGVGYRIYGKMLGMVTLDFREVGVGIQEIVDAVNQNPEMVNTLIGQDVSMMSGTEIANLVNSQYIYVGTFKPPNNRGQDIQRRRLRVLQNEQRGIYLHPVMAAMYTADFDGDDMEVSLDPSVAELARDPMDYMVGIDGEQSLNTDFLPVAKIIDGYAEGKTARDYVREVMFASFAQIDGRSIRALVDAVLELGDSENQAVAWGKVFREARILSDAMNPNSKNRADDMMSRLCQAVYKGMYDIKRQTAYTSIGADIVSTAGLPTPRTYGDTAVYKVLDGIQAGEVPNNFQELKIAMTGFLGNVEGKNAPFRFTADVGKMMKMDSRLQIGDGSFEVDPNNEEQMTMFFESTMKYAESYRLAREIKKAGRSQYYTQLMRDLVIKDVGFPDDLDANGDRRYQNYSMFLDRFVKSYSRHSATINEANLVSLTSGEISSDSNRGIVSPINPSAGGVTFGDIAEPMLSIYGTYSVGRMFHALSTPGYMGERIDERWKGNPNHVTKLRKTGPDASKPLEREFENSNDEFWITGKYLSWSLRQFKNENRLLRGENATHISDIRATRINAFANDSVSAQYNMLMAIADKRTGTASKFNESIYGKERKRRDGSTYVDYEGTTVQMMSDLVTELNRLDTDGTISGRADQMLYVDDVVATLATSGPDMFYHFGMDNTAGFLQSNWAKKIAQHASDPEVIGGIRLAMVFDYRMERIRSLQADVIDPNQGIARWMQDISNLQFAKDELSASSEVWRGIMKEFVAEATLGEESVFSILSRGKRPVQKSISGEEYEWRGESVTLDAGKFWANPGEHTTLQSVIEDLDLDLRTKYNVIVDIVRYWEHDAYLKSYEVGYQMEIGNDSSYDLVSGAAQSALGTHKDFEKAFNRWGQMSQQKLQEEVIAAANKWNTPSNKGSLMATLQRLNAEPWSLVAINDLMYADSIMSVKDKTYAQTEKASQHPWTNAVYAALSMQRNGGYMNDITRTDDRLLGVQNSASLNIQDVIRILADPEASLWVYNGYGEKTQLTREILLQNSLGHDLSANVESDIWEFLQQNPRIAAAIRVHNACAAASTDGDGYLGATLSISETIGQMRNAAADPIGHVKYLMRDHPVYAGIISLVSPARGAVTRNERRRVREIETYLAHQIYAKASSQTPANRAAFEIMNDLGITESALKQALRSNYDMYLEARGLPTSYGTDESESDAMGIYIQVGRSLTGYINDVRSSVQLGLPIFDAPGKPKRIGIDVVSAASFWDVVQELGGAKTSVSTGIEGAETYQFAEWASHITAQDHYADLEAIPDGDVDQSWNGAWTSVGIPLSVDEAGNITNYDAIVAAKGEGNEVVVMTPNGYQVKDRSTDSRGTQVASLFAYMVSKRSNGAEAFNLKAKKAGIDKLGDYGYDSVTKMQGKYRTETDDDGTVRLTSLEDVQDYLRRTAQQNGENGLLAAKLELANMMLEENNELGYDDLTLSNFMSIADLMLIQGADGELYLRSLEMLFTAIKHRIGPRVDEMTDAEIRAAADAIVNDTSETGVGIAMMASPLDALGGIRPRTKSMATDGIRPSSSVFERNFDLLSKITEQSGYDPISPAKAKQLTERYSVIKGIAEVIKKSSVIRNHSVVGYAAAADGSEQIDWTVGPSNAIIIGSGKITDSRLSEICHQAWDLGMTVIVDAENIGKIPSEYRADAMPCSYDGSAMLPFFDMRLNGSEAAPYNGGRWATFQAPYSRYVVSVEDSVNEFELGDAQARATKGFVDRIKVVDNGSKRITAEELFPNVFRNPDFRHSLTTVSLASGNEIENLIAKDVRCTIDYGIVEGGRGFEQRKHDVDAAIERYRARWSEADADGIIRGDMTECHPGDIVGWAELLIVDQLTDKEQVVLAPIIPFPLHGPTKGIPETFSVQQLATVDKDNTLFAVDWSNTSDVSNGFAKYFDSSGGANKGMMSFGDTIDSQRLLRDGTPVDVYIAKASTDSRKIGTDRRIKTMISLMALARMHGYNFARSDGAFPDNPSLPDGTSLRDTMLTRRIPTSDWQKMLSTGDIRFTTDQRLNAFINWECNKVLQNGGNPSDLLANVFTNADGTEQNTYVMWEFEAMFDQGINYEDSLLRFLHFMDPGFCPNGIDDMGEQYTFRLYRDADGSHDGYDNGVLQMQVPHQMTDGRTSYLWDNVYIGMSFFGEDYSGFSRPNIDGASNFLDAMNTMSYYGAQLDERSARFRAMWATADIGRLPRDGGALGKA